MSKRGEGRRRSRRRSRCTLTPRPPRSRAAMFITASVCPSWRVPTSTVIISPASSGGFGVQGDTVTWQRELARTPLHLVAFGEDARRRALPARPRPDAPDLSPGPEHGRQTITRLSPPSEPDGTLCLNPRPSAGAGRDPLLGQCPALVRRCDGRAVSGRPGRRPDRARSPGHLAFSRRIGSARTVSIEQEPGKPASRRRMETQILHLEAERGGPTLTSGTTTRPMPSWPARRGQPDVAVKCLAAGVN